MSDYRCEGCRGHLIDGQEILLLTRIVSVVQQQLGTSVIWHKKCYKPAKRTS